jgi:hypothetical protein
MKTNLLLFALVLSLLGSGCAATNYKITQAPPEKSDTKLQTIDSLQCEKSAQLNWPGIFEVAICGIGAKICQNIRDNNYESCMSGKGYKVKPID